MHLLAGLRVLYIQEDRHLGVFLRKSDPARSCIWWPSSTRYSHGWLQPLYLCYCQGHRFSWASVVWSFLYHIAAVLFFRRFAPLFLACQIRSIQEEAPTREACLGSPTPPYLVLNKDRSLVLSYSDQAKFGLKALLCHFFDLWWCFKPILVSF